MLLDNINIFFESYRCIVGALVGDAAGAILEFCHEDITENKAKRALTMPGGGCIRVGNGQITDDGELALSLYRALTLSDAHITNAYPYKECIEEYIKWYISQPFDIGGTCSSAFQYGYELYDEYNKNIDKSIISSYINFVYHNNEQSEANGGLMRISALPTWAIQHNIDLKYVIEMSKNDALLSHPNEVCQEVNSIYVFICMNLLKGINPSNVLSLVNDYVNNEIKSEKVHNWFFKESIDIDNINATKCIGHVRHAFTLAIYFLRNPDITFEKAIMLTLMKGGDTDTNAAIVGGLVACYHNIPEYMLRPVLSFDSTECDKIKRGHLRPKEYCVKYVLNQVN
jgi:ADP-ribosyl-[dinitrogen reductase] hydrolase